MRNIKLILEYDGTRYQGWQQPGKKDPSGTISGRLTGTLCRMTGEEIELFCAARTEPGVHASCQTVSFKTASRLPVPEIRRELNQYLPQDIAVLRAEEVPERFHASLNLLSQTYTYRIHTGAVMDVFRRKYMFHVPRPLDISAMKAAASQLVGTHDFRCLSFGRTKKSCEKELLSAEIVSPAEEELCIVLEASSFLHQMPRLIAGTLLDVGTGVRDAECIPAILSGREPASRPAPPAGLCLTQTRYEESALKSP